LYLSKYTFDAVAEAVDLDTIAEVFSPESSFEIIGVIDEKHGVGNVVFLTELGEEFPCDRDRIRRKQPRMEDLVRFRINSGVQPVLFVVDSDRLLVNSNSIRVFTARRL
jgi:hypothetical protein